jgi:hypothetical protein
MVIMALGNSLYLCAVINGGGGEGGVEALPALLQRIA